MNNKNTFAVAFYCRNSKRGRKGTAPIEASISINGKRTFMALPRKEVPSEFEKAMASRRNSAIKQFCSLFEARINETMSEMLRYAIPMTADNLKDCIMNGVVREYKVKDLYNEYMAIMRERTRSEITYDVYRRYEISLSLFLELAGNKDVSQISNADVVKYRTYVASTHHQSTLYGYMARLKSMVRFAMNNGKLSTDPFVGIKTPKGRTKIEIPSEEEYNKILSKRFDIPRLEKVRLMWLLGANTGLSYSDLMLLQKGDVMECNGRLYINKCRKKTNVEYTSVVLDDGRKILEEYVYDISPLKMSNQKLNFYLGEIKDACGIKGKLTMHIGRHMYCSRLIKSGVPIAIVQKCLGHSRITTTQQFYTHLTTEAVIDNVARVLNREA